MQPSVLETRDNYFTNTIEKIEYLYHFNENTPVVILSHSMGCRASHYLFNFVIHKKGKDDGIAWLDKYIKFWIPVGAPHIGTPTSGKTLTDMCDYLLYFTYWFELKLSQFAV